MAPTFCLLTASLLAGQSEMPIHPSGSVSAAAPGGDCNCQQGAGGGPWQRLRGWFRSGNDQCADRPGLVNRVREWFGRDDGYSQGGYSHGSGYAQNPSRSTHNYANSSGLGGAHGHVVSGNGSATPGNGQALITGSNQSLSRPVPEPLNETREPELARPAARKQVPVKQAPVVRQEPPAKQTSAASPIRQAFNNRSGPSLQPPPARVENKINPRFVNSIGHGDDYSWITGQLDREGNRWVIRYATPDTIDRYNGVVALAPGIDLSHLRAGELVSANGQITGTNNGFATFRATAVNKIQLIDEN